MFLIDAFYCEFMNMAEFEPNIPLEQQFDWLYERLSTNAFKRIVVMSGAGISTGAGIPDYRSKGGMFDQHASSGIDPIQAASIDYYRLHPEVLLSRTASFYATEYEPTITHRFIRALDRRGLLLRSYTQNIDGLETKAGVSAERLVEAHGGLGGVECSFCRKYRPTDTSLAEFKRAAIAGDAVPRCNRCNYPLKPTVILYGENLRRDFRKRVYVDFRVPGRAADLVLIIGTSLLVQPFNNVVAQIPQFMQRVFINMTPVAHADRNRDLTFWSQRSDKLLGRLAEKLGWRDVFDASIEVVAEPALLKDETATTEEEGEGEERERLGEREKDIEKPSTAEE